MIKLSKISTNILLFILLVVGYFTFIFPYIQMGNDGFIFSINYILVSMAIIIAKKNISIYKMSLYFLLIFMVIAPAMQLTSGFSPWDQILSQQEIADANIIVMIYTITYICSYLFFSRKYENIKKIKFSLLPNSLNFFIILFIISLICLILGIRLYGFSELFTRTTGTYNADTLASTNSLLFLLDSVVRSMPVISLGIFISSIKSKIFQSGKSLIYSMTVLLMLIVLILDFPVNLSRFESAAVYLGLIIIVTNLRFWKNKKFDILLIVSLIFIFPFFGLFKTNTLSEALSQLSNFQFINFNSSDFDAFSLLAKTTTFVSQFGLQMGNQLKNVIFFFVPHFVWNIKGIPSGQLVASSLGFYYTNVSEPIMGEGFIDFGYFGVIIYAIIFAKLSAKIDGMVYRIENQKNQSTYYRIIFAFTVGFTVYLMRGALQPTFLRLMGFFLLLIIIYVLQKLTISKEKS